VGFGTGLGLASLVYEIFPLYPCLALYVLIRRTSVREVRGLTLSLGIGLIVYFGFLWVEGPILGTNLQSLHSAYQEASWKSIRDFIVSASFGQQYATSVLALRTYFGSLVNAFFVVPILLALLGAFLVRNRSRALTVLTFAVPSALAVAFLQVGGVQWGNPQ